MVKCNLRKPLRSARISLIQALSLSLLTFSNSSIATLVKKQTRLARHITNQPGKFQMHDVFKPTTGTSTVARPRKAKQLTHCIVSSPYPGKFGKRIWTERTEHCSVNTRNPAIQTIVGLGRIETLNAIAGLNGIPGNTTEALCHRQHRQCPWHLADLPRGQSRSVPDT